VFEATCNGKRDIVPEAWGGGYPCQVRVRLCSRERIAVPRPNIDRFVTDPVNLRVRNKVFGTSAHELLQYFAGGSARGQETGQRMDSIEEDFRRSIRASSIVPMDTMFVPCRSRRLTSGCRLARFTTSTSA